MHNSRVTRLRLVFVSTLLVLGAAACEKPYDVNKLREEATATNARYQPELATLDRRTDDVLAEGEKLSPSVPGTEVAIKTLTRERGVLAALHTLNTDSAKDIATAAGAGEHAVDALHKVIDETNEHYDVGLREANAELTSVESWIAESRMYPAPVAAASDPYAARH